MEPKGPVDLRSWLAAFAAFPVFVAVAVASSRLGAPDVGAYVIGIVAVLAMYGVAQIRLPARGDVGGTAVLAVIAVVVGLGILLAASSDREISAGDPNRKACEFVDEGKRLARPIGEHVRSSDEFRGVTRVAKRIATDPELRAAIEGYWREFRTPGLASSNERQQRYWDICDQYTN